MSFDTVIKDMCGLGMGIFMVFEILGHFPFKGDGTTPRCSLIQGTRIYMVKGWGSQ
jgi:hypothetical protein